MEESGLEWESEGELGERLRERESERVGRETVRERE